MEENKIKTINGDSKVSDFTDVYNNNNKVFINIIKDLQNQINELKEQLKDKANTTSLNNRIHNEVIRVLDVEYNSENNPRRFVRLGDVKEIVKDIVNG